MDILRRRIVRLLSLYHFHLRPIREKHQDNLSMPCKDAFRFLGFAQLNWPDSAARPWSMVRAMDITMLDMYIDRAIDQAVGPSALFSTVAALRRLLSWLRAQFGSNEISGSVKRRSHQTPFYETIADGDDSDLLSAENALSIAHRRIEAYERQLALRPKTGTQLLSDSVLDDLRAAIYDDVDKFANDKVPNQGYLTGLAYSCRQLGDMIKRGESKFGKIACVVSDLR